MQICLSNLASFPGQHKMKNYKIVILNTLLCAPGCKIQRSAKWYSDSEIYRCKFEKRTVHLLTNANGTRLWGILYMYSALQDGRLGHPVPGDKMRLYGSFSLWYASEIHPVLSLFMKIVQHFTSRSAAPRTEMLRQGFKSMSDWRPALHGGDV